MRKLLAISAVLLASVVGCALAPGQGEIPGAALSQTAACDVSGRWVEEGEDEAFIRIFQSAAGGYRARLEKTHGELPFADGTGAVRWSASLQGLEAGSRRVTFQVRKDAFYVPHGGGGIEIIEYDVSLSSDCRALIGTWRHIRALLGKGNGEKVFIRLRE
jgi:hypothetical protein